MHPLRHDISQLGFVVRDLSRALEHWIESVGVGPFFVAERIEPTGFVHRDDAHDVAFTAALANSGSVQIELLQPLDDTPSMWREFLDAGREGLQHIGYWTEDYDRDFAAMLGDGRRVVHHGMLSGGRFSYFEHDFAPGVAIELSEQSEAKQQVFGAIRDAAVDWDGADPRRPFESLPGAGA